MAGRPSWPGLFRLDPAGATTLAAMAVLHITDIHADPFYNVSWYGCGYDGSTRNIALQDKGQPAQNLCKTSTELVASECGPFASSYEEMSRRWPETTATGPMCPCGVSYSDPPFSVMPPLRAALEEFANDGFAAQAAIYTGDLVGHYMPGNSATLEQRCCRCLPRAPRALAPAPALALTLTLTTAPNQGVQVGAGRAQERDRHAQRAQRRAPVRAGRQRRHAEGHEPGSPDPDLSPTTLSLSLTTNYCKPHPGPERAGHPL